jgi:type I restriction enzyme S subunit
MTYELKPYPAMKDSGEAWLDKVPESWDCLRSKYLLREIDRRTQSGEEPLLSMRRDHGLVPLSRFSKKVTEPNALLGYKLVRPGELVVNRMQAGNGLVFVSRIPGLISPDYAIFNVIRPVNVDFLELLFRSYPMRAKFRRESTGLGTGTAGFLRLYGDSLGSIGIPIPPLDVQSLIVRFIRHSDLRINRYIRAKQKLIKLLRDQKQAVIHGALTRGLELNVRLKPSGVEWLGDVPAHWEVRPLGRFITLQRGFDITKEQQTQGPVPVVSSGGVSSYHNQSTSSGPGVVVGRKGSAGTVHFIDGAFWAHDTTLWVKAFNGNHPRFIYYALCRLDLKRFDTGSANPTINRNIVHPEIVSFPPPEEQHTIAAFLDNMVDQAGKLIGDANREILLLREYRTRLIADVVTGKLDVRAAAASLPDEPDEPEAVGDIDTLAEGDDDIPDGDIDGAPEEADNEA